MLSSDYQRANSSLNKLNIDIDFTQVPNENGIADKRNNAKSFSVNILQLKSTISSSPSKFGAKKDLPNKTVFKFKSFLKKSKTRKRSIIISIYIITFTLWNIIIIIITLITIIIKIIIIYKLNKFIIIKWKHQQTKQNGEFIKL